MDLLSTGTGCCLLAAWFFLAGGAVGSFLNVVVYRLPAGMSINLPASHCPRCKHPIRWYDNVPMLAWFWLRGRCRDCGQPIAFRYPLVEAAAAGLFLLLAMVEALQGGQNLPGHPYPPVRALGVCLLHLGLLCTLSAAALIRWDKQRPPPGLFIPIVLTGLATPLVWPWLRPVAAATELQGSAWRGLADGLAGAAIAYVIGRAAQWLGKRTAVLSAPGSQILGECLAIGVVLGWQAVAVLAPLSLALEELSRIAAVRWPGARRLAAAVWIAPLTLLWILNWARLAAWLGM